MLIITKEHKETLFDTTYEEKESMFDLLSKCKEYIDNKYKPTGYNIGFNCGVSAGQSIMHVHMHIIPRYDNDIEKYRDDMYVLEYVPLNEFLNTNEIIL